MKPEQDKRTERDVNDDGVVVPTDITVYDEERAWLVRPDGRPIGRRRIGFVVAPRA